MKDLMTGNELDIPVTQSKSFNPAESVGQWLRDTGSANSDLKKRVEELERQLAELHDKRQKQVAVMQELAQLLKLKFPDPKKIVDEVKRITSL